MSRKVYLSCVVVWRLDESRRPYPKRWRAVILTSFPENKEKSELEVAEFLQGEAIHRNITTTYAL